MKVLKVREGASLNKAMTQQVKHKNESEKQLKDFCLGCQKISSTFAENKFPPSDFEKMSTS